MSRLYELRQSVLKGSVRIEGCPFFLLFLRQTAGVTFILCGSCVFLSLVPKQGELTAIHVQRFCGLLYGLVHEPGDYNEGMKQAVIVIGRFQNEVAGFIGKGLLELEDFFGSGHG